MMGVEASAANPAVLGVLLAAEQGEPGPFAGGVAQSIAAILAFLILLAALYRFAWGPILEGLQERENKIRQDLEHAERAAQQADETLQEYKQHLAQAEQEARQIVEQSRTDAERVNQQLKQQTQRELQQMRQRADQEIQAAKEQALNDIYDQTATLATQAASRILQRELNEEDQKRLVDESLQELSKLRS
jgi:F-type H+-transporting ATPase subunit b